MVDVIYVGMVIGVYYMFDVIFWMFYEIGLLNVFIYDLEINYINNKIWVGIYGRGLWEVVLFGLVVLVNDFCIDVLFMNCGDIVSGDIIMVIFDSVGICGIFNIVFGVWYFFIVISNFVILSICN